MSCDALPSTAFWAVWKPPQPAHESQRHSSATTATAHAHSRNGKRCVHYSARR